MAQDVLAEALARLEPEMSTAAMWAVAARPDAWKAHRESSRAAISAKELNIREAISQSCAEWVESGRWPVMSPEDALYVWERVWRAHHFGNWLRTAGLVSQQKSVNELLLWLLVDGWVNIFQFEWKEDLFGS